MKLTTFLMILTLAAACANEKTHPGSPSGERTGGPGDGTSGGPPATPVGAGITASGVIALEPFRGEDITFARPARMVRKDAPAGTYRFERAEASGDALNAFQMTYLGRIRGSQLPGEKYLLEKLMAERKLTIVKDSLGEGWLYAQAIGDSGIESPNRYVQIMQMSRWDTDNEPLTGVSQITKGVVPPTFACLVIELSAPSVAALEKASAHLILRAIAWSASVINEVVPAEALPGGHWGYGKTTIADFTASGEFKGSLSPGEAFDVKFEPGNRYQLVTSRSVANRNYISPDRYYVVGGLVTTYSRGEYRAEGGVITFAPDLCTVYSYSTLAPPAKRSDCVPEVVPMALRFEQSENGRIRVNGTSTDFTGWQYTFTIGRSDAPGAWNVPKPPGIRVPGEPSAPINDAYNVCGLTEKEPNGADETATRIAVGESVAACVATYSDHDYLEIDAPNPLPPSGWAELSVTDVSGQAAATEVREVDPDGVASHYLTDDKAMTPGQPLFLYWRLLPKHPKYRILIKADKFDALPFTYKADVVFHSVEDKNEPNDSTGTPLEYGVTKTGYLIDVVPDDFNNWDRDVFTVHVTPGMLRIRVEDLPANLNSRVSMRLREDNEDATIMGTTAELNYMVTSDEDAKIEVWAITPESGTMPARGQVPENLRKPYRITVTRP
jgi:hypothetical protein